MGHINGKEIDYQTYDYDKEKIYSQDLLDNALRPTTKGIFFTKDEMDQNPFKIIKDREYSSLFDNHSRILRLFNYSLFEKNSRRKAIKKASELAKICADQRCVFDVDCPQFGKRLK